jgi:hypothetical protein
MRGSQFLLVVRKVLELGDDVLLLNFFGYFLIWRQSCATWLLGWTILLWDLAYLRHWSLFGTVLAVNNG